MATIELVRSKEQVVLVLNKLADGNVDSRIELLDPEEDLNDKVAKSLTQCLLSVL